MPSGADLEYARLLSNSGYSSGQGLDGARLAQLEDQITYEQGQDTVIYVGGKEANDLNDGLKASKPKATVFSALTALGTNPGTVIMAPGYISNEENNLLVIDPSKHRIKGAKSVITHTSMSSAGYNVLISTSVASGCNGNVVLDGVSFRPAFGTLSGPGIKMGDGVNRFWQAEFSHGLIVNYTEALRFSDEIWQLTFAGFNIESGIVYVPPGLVNMGERMIWRDSVFNSGSPVVTTHLVYSGEWNFIGCSFLTTTMGYRGSSVIANHIACHFENLNNADYTFISAQNNAMVHVVEGRSVINGTSYVSPLFTSDASNNNTLSGLYVHASHTINRPPGTTVLSGSGRSLYQRDPLAFLSPATYQCRLVKTDTTALNTGTITVIPFGSGTETYDAYSMHDESNNTSRITIPVGLSGKWKFIGYARFGSNATGMRRALIKRDGITDIIEDRRVAVSGSITTVEVTAGPLQCTEGQYFELFLEQNSGGSISTDNALGTGAVIFRAEYQGP